MEKMAVIGIGRLGLCLALQLEKAGHEVLGIDKNAHYIDSILDRSFSSPEPGVEEALRSVRNFRASGDMQDIVAFSPDMIFVAVPTPAAEEAGYSHLFVDEVLQELYELPSFSCRKEIVIVCTTLPGYCDGAAARHAAQERSAPAAPEPCPTPGHPYFLSYKPEFIAQGSILNDLQYPDVVLIGEADAIAGDRLGSLYLKMASSQPKVCRMSRLSAEITKLGTNCFLTMKISFANAIGDLSEKVGAETDKILSALGTDKRIGGRCLAYGFGYGGPCFPRDNRALRYFSGKNQMEFPLSRAADECNQFHLDFLFEQYMARYSREEPIHFYSVTYKPGTLILEESQQLALAVKLARSGKKVVIHEKEEVRKLVLERYEDLFEWA
jgi:UDPglucose 6-dehydrogenase